MIWVVAIVGLMVVVLLHELGHFTVALAVGIRPRSFYVGFPPAIVRTKRRGIEYGLGAIPLGGFVRIPGMHRPAARDLEAFTGPALREEPGLAPFVQRVRRALEAGDLEAARAGLPDLQSEIEAARLSTAARRSANRALRDVDEGTGADAYWRQPTWKRVATIAAGPAANLLVAFVIFFAVYASGVVTITGTTRVHSVESGTPAAAAGLRAGDRIVAVDKQPTRTFDAVSQRIRASDGRAITVTVVRDGNRIVLGPRKTIHSSAGYWIWGFVPKQHQDRVSYSLGTSGRLAGDDMWQVVTGTATAIGDLAHRSGREQLSGPVGIVRVSAQALQTSISDYLRIVGLISMSLALFNLLPLLPLDGGHILFSLIEAVRRRALAREIYERVSVAGIVLILLLMYVALHNDLTSGTPH